MKRKALCQIALMAAVLIIIVPQNRCDAIPAFARKYQISCQVCHSPAMPRLKAFGEEFATAGFRMTKYESPRYFIDTGDDRLSLFREFPIAVRFDGFVTYNFNDAGQTDFGAPFVLKILSGGEISDKLSYYFYFLLNERGAIAGIEDAFLSYNDLLGTGINVYLGQFQASDPLFKGELRFTLEPYKIYDAKPGNSSVSLKYERGMIFQKDLPTKTSIVFEILNGSGIGEAGSGFLFDKDKYKNFMLRVSQAVGNNVSLGLFGYTGKEILQDNVGEFTSEIKMIGPDLKINLDEKLILNVQYVRRMDSHVYFDSDESLQDDIVTDGGFVEAIYAPRGDMSKWYFTGLFNWVESEYNELDYTSGTLHAGYLIRRNIRLVTEYTQQFSGVSYGKVSAGFVSAF
jgi:hypothetical protein